MSIPSFASPSPCLPFLRNSTVCTRLISPTRPPPTRFSALSSIPNSFRSSAYPCTTPLQVDHSVHYIPNTSNVSDTCRTDWHFEDPDHGFLVLIDYPTTNSITPSQVSEMLRHIPNRLLQTHIVYGPNHPMLDITTILSSAINDFRLPFGFSALFMHAVDGVLRVAWLGSCGFVLIRDDDIQFRYYGAPPGVQAM